MAVLWAGFVPALHAAWLGTDGAGAGWVWEWDAEGGMHHAGCLLLGEGRRRAALVAP